MTEMIRYPLPSVAPEDAIPPVPYGGEPPLWHMLDEAIAGAAEDNYWLLRALGNAMLITGMLALVGLVAWLAW